MVKRYVVAKLYQETGRWIAVVARYDPDHDPQWYRQQIASELKIGDTQDSLLVLGRLCNAGWSVVGCQDNCFWLQYEECTLGTNSNKANPEADDESIGPGGAPEGESIGSF